MINNSIYYSPTKVYFGKGEENKLGSIIQEYDYKNILIIYGKSSIIKSGLLDNITKQLDEIGVKYSLRGGVEPNPKISFVVETNKVYFNHDIDLILAIGGGSVIDTAKAVAATLKENIHPLKVLTREVNPTKFIDVATILTLSAAGSELSSSCVLSDLELKVKRGFNNNNIRPVFSILNPELTYTVSKFQTANGIVDIMMHTLERFFNPVYNLDFTSEVSVGILRTVYKSGPIALSDPNNYEARANLMLAGSFSHNDLTGIGLENSLRVHQFEHALSALHDEISHGEGLAVTFVAWAKVMKTYHLDKMSYLSVRLFDYKGSSEEDGADFFINQLEKFYKEIGMRTKLREFNIKEEELLELTNLTTYNKTRVIKDAIDLDFDLVYKIFKEAY